MNELYTAQLKENERLRGLLCLHRIDDQPEQKAQSVLADASSYNQTKRLTGAQLSLDLLPAAEQKRILEKLVKVLAICERLK